VFRLRRVYCSEESTSYTKDPAVSTHMEPTSPMLPLPKPDPLKPVPLPLPPPGTEPNPPLLPIELVLAAPPNKFPPALNPEGCCARPPKDMDEEESVLHINTHMKKHMTCHTGECLVTAKSSSNGNLPKLLGCVHFDRTKTRCIQAGRTSKQCSSSKCRGSSH